jgi:diguanylate cyclase (GGDEF)-like protein/PAS domain S-box-containing protein
MSQLGNDILEQSDIHRNILDQLHEGVYLVDLNRTILYWNDGAERITGYSSSEVVGSSCADNILIHVDDEGQSLCKLACPLQHTMGDRQTREAEVFLHHKEGHRVPVLVRTAPLKDDADRVIGGIEVFNENLARSAMREEIETLRKLALQDQLTEIGNRRYAEMALQSRHSELDRYGWNFGVLLIDIDLFKRFNDRYGHDIGDLVLKMVASTLSSNIRTYDIVGRWGGEEFLVVIEKISADELASRAEHLRMLVESSARVIDGERLSVTISTGGSLARAGESIDDIVKRADNLLYRSKESGRNRCFIEGD